jgi:hypothetical protein
MKFSACQSPWPAEAHYAHLHGDIVIDPANRLIHSWRAFSPANALVFEYTSQSAPAGARLLASLHFRPFAAPEIYRDTVEFLYRWSNPQRFTVAVEQSIAAPAEKN